MEESDLNTHESLVNSLRTEDFQSVQQILNSSAFLPYNDETKNNATQQELVIDVDTQGQQLLPPSSTPDIGDDKRRKHECIIESIQILLTLILSPDPMVLVAPLVPLNLIETFFEKIDLQYCVPALRDSYDENTLYYTCPIHELCIDRKYVVLRILFKKLPLDVIRKELQRHDYVSIESMRATEDDVHHQHERMLVVVPQQDLDDNQGEDDNGLHNEEDDNLLLLPEERLCTPLQAAWEKILIDDPQLSTTPDRLDSITSLSELHLDGNQNIKDLIETSLLLLSAYDDHRYPPPSSATTRAAGEPEEESITSLFVAERITHVLILLGHCGHAALFRFIVRFYPKSLDTRDDDGNLPIHLLSSQTVFNVTRKEAGGTFAADTRNEERSDSHPHVEGHEEMELEREDDTLLLIDYNYRQNHEHQHGWDMPPLLMLLESYPQYASVPDKDHSLPIHLFLWSFRDNCERKEGLRDLFRNSLQDVGLLFLEEQRWNQDEEGGFGRVTFPYQQDLFSVLSGLIQADAQSLCQVDGVHGLYPFMIAASSVSEAPLDFAFCLLCADPTIIISSITTSGASTLYSIVPRERETLQ